MQMKLTDDSSRPRKGALLCMRADHEKKLSNDEQKMIYDKCDKLFDGVVSYTDTNVPWFVTKDKRRATVNSKLDEFRGAEMVVTDRLHGMVFAALTGSPCVALGNLNGKIKGTYAWIKNCDYIRFIDSLDDFDEAYESVLKTASKKYDYKHLVNDYMPLYGILKD